MTLQRALKSSARNWPQGRSPKGLRAGQYLAPNVGSRAGRWMAFASRAGKLRTATNQASGTVVQAHGWFIPERGARLGRARQGLARHGGAWLGAAGHGVAWLGKGIGTVGVLWGSIPHPIHPRKGNAARRGVAGQGVARLGVARQGLARHGLARDREWHTPWFESKARSSPKGERGWARRGMARHGGAWHGKARQGEVLTHVTNRRVCLSDPWRKQRAFQDRQGRQSRAPTEGVANRQPRGINPVPGYLVQGTDGPGGDTPPKVQPLSDSGRVVRPFGSGFARD